MLVRFASLLFTAILTIILGCDDAVLAELPNFSGTKHSQVQIVFDRNVIQPSESEPVGNLGLYIKLEPGWHTYWEHSGDAAKPPKIEWELPPHFSVYQPKWISPKRIKERGNLTVFGYSDETLIKWSLELPKLDYTGDKASVPVEFKARVSLLVCRDTCVPEHHSIERTFLVSSEKAIGESEDTKLFKAFQDRYPSTLPKPVPVFRSESGVVLEISSLLKDSVSNENLASALQLFPRPTGKVTGLTDPKLVSFKAEHSHTIHKGILQPVTFIGKSSLGGIIAISKAVSLTGKDQFYELPEIQSVSLSKQPTATVDADTGSLSFESESSVAQQVKPPVKIAEAPATFNFYFLFLAFIGGLILNLMPCVLPVLSIKVYSIVDVCQHSRSLVRSSAIFYALGVVASFAALAVLIAALKAAGHTIGWGFQFQSLYFLYFMVSAVFVFSLALMGGYGFTPPLANELNHHCNKVRHPLFKSFIEGILATLLSTPCSAPIVATVLTFALSSPINYALPIFVIMGLGLAFPVLLLSTVPKLSVLVPKPGAWMIRFRELLALILLGTVVWLLGVIQTISPAGILQALYLVFALSVLCWIFEVLESREPQKTIHDILKWGLFLLGVFFIYYCATQAVELKERVNKSPSIEPSATGIQWETYEPSKIATAFKDNRVVFIDFTAAWCITCKFNEQFTINTKEVIAAMEQNNVLALKADWTDGNEMVTKAIQSYGAEGVPLYVVVHPGKAPIVLSTLPAQSSIIEAIQNRN